jgi:sugar lactone lactonase YvrE
LLCAVSSFADTAPWNAAVQGKFITSLCRDLTGHVWIGTEGSGVWRFDPSAPLGSQYTQFISATPVGPGDTQAGPGDTPIAPSDTAVGPGDTAAGPGDIPADPGATADDLGAIADGPADTPVGPAAPVGSQSTQFISKVGPGDDNAYALVCDKAGRIWVGTLNHGVSVFNGKTWRTYGPADGPLGSRVFALAVSPKDGSVWGATEAGLFRYHLSRWTYFTRADGLPSDQANALAFAADGTLYVGTQCDGIAVGSPVNDYKTWRVTPGPKQMPNAATGSGLPSGLINALLVVRDGTVYAGTNCGLAASGDKGRTWHYRRGEDWKDKLAGFADPIAPSQHHVTGKLLREDYVTCLTEDADHSLWIGYRQKGVELYYRDPKHPLIPDLTDPDKSEFISSLLPDGAGLWVGHYGEGLALRYAADVSSVASSSASSHNGVFPPLPVPAKSPSLAELNAMLRAVRAVVPDKNDLAPKVVALDDDWVTEGDWLGRYGRYWACLCATSAPTDYVWGAGWEPVRYALQMGPHHTGDDKLRYWIQWLYTQNPHVLELPSVYMDTRVLRNLTTWDNNRRESEVDDHGEAYRQAQDGPNIYETLDIPHGLFTLSLYDVNYNGHSGGPGGQRSRDYRISIRLQSGRNIGDISGFDKQSEWAHGRIQGFWGGVYKRFLVRGPVTLTVKVDRNNSFNTMLPAAMLDLVDENPPPYHGTPEERLVWRNTQRQLLLAQWQSKKASQRFPPAQTEAQAADELLEALQDLQFTNGTWQALNGHRFYSPLLRWYAAQVKLSTLPNKSLLSSLATCDYQMGMYDAWEQCQRQAGLTPARDVEQALRWNGANGFGHGFEAVSEYVAHHSAIAQKGGYPQLIPVFQPGSIEAGGH